MEHSGRPTGEHSEATCPRCDEVLIRCQGDPTTTMSASTLCCSSLYCDYVRITPARGGGGVKRAAG